MLGEFSVVVIFFLGAQLRIAIVFLLATVPWSVSAETSENEKLNEVLAKLRACVRTYAPAARTQNARNPLNFLIETCSPPLRASDLTSPGASPDAKPGALSPNDLAGVGAIPPGLFRHVVSEEWADIIDPTRAR